MNPKWTSVKFHTIHTEPVPTIWYP